MGTKASDIPYCLYSTVMVLFCCATGIGILAAGQKACGFAARRGQIRFREDCRQVVLRQKVQNRIDTESCWRCSQVTRLLAGLAGELNGSLIEAPNTPYLPIVPSAVQFMPKRLVTWREISAMRTRRFTWTPDVTDSRLSSVCFSAK